jgi:hypothetical protein
MALDWNWLPWRRLEAKVDILIGKVDAMASALDQKITDLQTAVTAEDTVIDSAVTLIKGIPSLIQDAINQALAAGATAAQLQALTDLKTTMDTKANDLAQAVTANTPTPPTP